MEQNKYNKFFSTQSHHELIEMKMLHDSKQKRLDKNWYDALVKYIEYHGIDESDVIETKVPDVIIDKPVIDPGMIKAAGKALKKSVIVSILLMILSVGMTLVLTFAKLDSQKQMMIWPLMGIINLIGIILIFSSIYNAGQQLEYSVSSENK